MSTTTKKRGIFARSMLMTPLLAAGLIAGLSSGPVSGTTAAAAAPAKAAPQTITMQNTATTTLTLAQRGLRIAAAQRGKPYRWGADGPYAYDCSGLVYYTYTRVLHRNLPRTANAQRLATVRIAKSSVRPGDLIFFMSGGRAYHVGVYAGYGKVWHAPRPGQYVQLSRIWTTAWVAGRVR
jgi:cell wall-associated NlpC family hydrolase